MRHLRKPYRKFLPQNKKIEELEQNNDRFKRIFSEYESVSEDLWNWENNLKSNVPDDFVDAAKLQYAILKDEIEDWLGEDLTEDEEA